jgi:hypothetical protein
LSASDDAAAGVIVVTGIIGAMICLFVAFVLGIGGISGTRLPVFASMLAVGAIALPMVGLAVLKGEPSALRRIIATAIGAAPSILILLFLFRVFSG